MHRLLASITLASLALVGVVAASAAAPADIASQAATDSQIQFAEVQRPLPELRVVETPTRLDARVTLDLAFGYEFASPPGGRATVELWFRRKGVSRAELLGVQHDVALQPKGTFTFETGPRSIDPIDPPCDRLCLLFLKVKRGSHERMVQMGLAPTLFDELARTDRTVTPVGKGLASYRVQLQSYDRNCSSCPPERAKIGVGRDFDLLRVTLRSNQGEAAPTLRNVHVEAVFRKRRGGEQILAAKRITLEGGRGYLEVDTRGFRVPADGGAFEVRVSSGRTTVRAEAKLVPINYRVTKPARVRDRR